MAGVIFILIVLLMAVACVAILLHGRPLLLIDPQPSYVIVEDEGEYVDRVQRVWYYLPQQRTWEERHAPAFYRDAWEKSQGSGRTSD